jgi:hypothetical protein
MTDLAAKELNVMRAVVLAALSTAIGLLGWVPLAVSAGLAQGTGRHRDTAVALILAGVASLLGLSLGGAGLFLSHRGINRLSTAAQIGSVLGVAIGAVLGLVALIFAFSFRW